MKNAFAFTHNGPRGLCAAVVVLMCAGVSAAQASDKKQTAKAPPAAITIPKDAVANPGGASYTWTDKDGKKWIFVKTPFGITKSVAENQPADSATNSGVKVTENGDMVKFERPGPFGTIKWEKKKSDLTDEERRMLDAQNAKTAPPQTANTEQK